MNGMQPNELIVPGVVILNLGVSVAMGFGLYLLNARQRKMDRLEENVVAASREAAQQGVQLAKAEVAAEIAVLRDGVKRHEDRLATGEKEFERGRQAEAEIRIEVMQRLDRLNEKLDGRFATAADLKRLEERVSRIETQRASGH
jgi:hypothetical protein